MNIRVKILGHDRTIEMDAEASDTIASIKTKLNRDTTIALRNMRLIYGNANEMEDSSQLSAYNIQNGAWLKLAVKKPEDRSTTVGCDLCDVRFSQVHEDHIVYLCEVCAANDAIRGEFCPINCSRPKKKRT